MDYDKEWAEGELRDYSGFETYLSADQIRKAVSILKAVKKTGVIKRDKAFIGRTVATADDWLDTHLFISRLKGQGK